MTGATEILVLIVLILGILILPRMLNPGSSKKKSLSEKLIPLKPSTRAGIVLTLVYPIAMALYLKPWENHLVRFLSLGVLPVFIVWSVVWILCGRKK